MSVQVSLKVNPCQGDLDMTKEVKDLLRKYDWTNKLSSRLSDRYKDWNITKLNQTKDKVTFRVSFKEGKTNSQDVKLGLYELIQTTPTIKVQELKIT